MKISLKKMECRLCGACVRNCISDCFLIKDNKVILNNQSCFHCGSCVSVCPDNRILGLNSNDSYFNEEFENIIIRRTCRVYKEDEISEETIRKLIKVSSYAPSAKNIRKQKFICIMGKEKIRKLTGRIFNFFSKLSRIIKYLNFPLIKRVLTITGVNVEFFNKTLNQFEKALNKYKNGEEPLFHGATALIICISPKTVPLRSENGAYSLYSIIMASEKLGIGSCINGFAQIAFKFSGRLRNYIKLPPNYIVTGVLGLGYRKDKVLRIPLRPLQSIRFQ